MAKFDRLSARAAAAAAISVLALGLAACGSDDSDSGNRGYNGGTAGGGEGGGGGTIIRGTTDQPVSFDPAGAYDLPSYDIIYSTYQNLMTVPPGEAKAVPEAAQSCDFTDPKTYKCTMKDGLKFSDGSPLDARDVKFSFDRNVKIADPQGASSLLAGMKSVEAPDPKTVIFHLKAPDATWPLLMTVASFAIVPSDKYPANKLQPNDKVIGSGRYTLAEFKSGQQTVLERNENYTGDSPANNDRAIIQYFDKGSALKLAVQRGDVDIAYRSLSPTDIEDLRNGGGGVKIVEGNGTEIRYFAFNTKLQPGADDAQKLAIRKAAAQVIDRQAIADNVYNGTVTPLYSMVPQGLQFATQPYKDLYGESANVDAAKKTLADAGVKTPVKLEVWWTPSHYGPSSGDEYAEIKRQFDESGLFNVTLKSTEWNQYSEAAFTDKYPVYELGWFPDYPDADDYVAPFYGKESFLNIHYDNPKMNDLLAQEKAETDADKRADLIAQIQKIGAEDTPTVPVWQGKQVAAVREGITGVEDTFDPSFIFRYWLIGKES
jgi:peptide/nickel transport system substrate-binding protein